ncbi:AGAP003396-PA-like protein [Anopheles sinensis]|uniref:AGAP003396-PA-like protein n=1 Tax=Anopheles sinensis TaxID=74873 RepID=A0A084W7D0_ANOSI|nr:AGAP003396-PA-like protein [Anopheles sinensis]
MIIKIYLSSKLIEKFTFCDLYGLVEDLRDEIRFTVLDDEPLPGYTEPIGKLCSVADYVQFRAAQNDKTLREQLAREDNFLRLAISNSGRIKHVMAKVKGVTIESLNKLLIIYDEKGFNNLAENDLTAVDCDNALLHLARLIKATKTEPAGIVEKVQTLAEFDPVQRLLCALRPIGNVMGMVFRKTALYYHWSEWVECVQQKDQNAVKWTLLMDIGFGVAVLSLILWFGNPGTRFMEFAEVIVDSLLKLLQTLRGNPIGLKLNGSLNEFFFSCFSYQVDLWWMFLIILSPAIQFLFIPLSVLGLFGLSFQVAMLSDLIVLISLHAHCFYIYVAVLYRIEVGGLRALYRTVLGKKHNVLRDRVEAHDYMNRQLFLATLSFTVLLFLLPTILFYYIVFASLRFAIYCLSYGLMTIRRTILHFPFNAMIRWVRGVYTNLESLEIYNIGSIAKENVTITYVAPRAASFWFRDTSTDPTRWESNHHATKTIGQFFTSLIKGELVSSIQPDEWTAPSAKTKE